MVFYNLLADCQADAGAGIRIHFLQTLEDDKNFLRMLRIYSDPVIVSQKKPIHVLSSRPLYEYSALHCP